MPSQKRKAVEDDIVPSTRSSTKFTARGRAINTTAAAARAKRSSARASGINDQSKPSTEPVTKKPRLVPSSYYTDGKRADSTSRPRKNASKDTNGTSSASTRSKPASKARKPAAKTTSSTRALSRPAKIVRDESMSILLPTNTKAESSTTTDTAEKGTKAQENVAVNGSVGHHERGYWLMKAEPESRIEKTESGLEVDVKFSIDDLQAKAEPEPWDGIRNVVAQKNLRSMRVGDLAFFYESNVKKPGIVGLMEIVREASPDTSAWNKDSPYFDSKTDPDKPRWQLVHVKLRGKFKQKVGLKELQSYGKDGGVLANMQLLKQSRLSVSKVTPEEWTFIKSLVDDEDFGLEEAENEGESRAPVETMQTSRGTDNDTEATGMNDAYHSIEATGMNGADHGTEALDTNVIADGARIAPMGGTVQESIENEDLPSHAPASDGLASKNTTQGHVAEELTSNGLALDYLDVTNRSVASVDLLDAEPEVTSPTYQLMSPAMEVTDTVMMATMLADEPKLFETENADADSEV